MDLTAEKTLLVASVAPASNAEAFEAARDAASLPAGRAVELRVDAMREAPAFAALRAAFAGRTLIATVRSAPEGGSFRGNEEEEKDLLEGALAAGFDFADVEFRRDGSGRAWSSSLPPSKKISSLHDPEGIPADLDGVVARMLSSGARYVKIVATANDVSDVLRLLELQAAHRNGRLSVFGMGEAGIATRVLSPYLGAALSFGALDPARTTAPGQVAARDLAEVYGIGRPRRVRRLFALLGDRVSHSLSPAIHNANFEALGLDALYVPFALRSLGAELPVLVAGLDALGIPLAAASVTIPFKEEAAHLADADEKAVNTLVRISGTGATPRWRSANTDRDAFEQVIPESPERGETGERAAALVFGAGGTARVAVEVLRRKGWEVHLANRGDARGEQLARETGALFHSKKSDAALPEPRLVVHATPLGLREGDPVPCPVELLKPGVLVIDAPYRAEGTELVRAARAAGSHVVDGQTLLLLQAAGQASRFTGSETGPDVLLARLPASRRAALSSCEEFLRAPLTERAS
ncbi:MAG TPA: type I 3-dehydroquinate dehydratase [Thermoanaerobaculia bacterium]|nr:type I 3-dehydroquinate dehydratase [Thermoanaerobaculia bacterium]